MFNPFTDSRAEQDGLDMSRADAILETVFRKNNHEPNTVSVHDMILYHNYRMERYLLQRGLIVLLFVLFVLFPLLFISPRASLEQGEDLGPGRPLYVLEVYGSMPIRTVTVTVGEDMMPVYETGSSVYTIQPTENGTMTVTVCLYNWQTCTRTVDVNIVDVAAPVMVDSESDRETLTFFLTDADSGLDLAAAYAQTESDVRVSPISWDEKAGSVTFPYPKESMNLYFFDKVGNQLQVVLSLQKEQPAEETPEGEDGESEEEGAEGEEGTEGEDTATA